MLDQSKKNDRTFYGEAVRLSNELRNKSAQTIITPSGKRVDTPAKTDGFDIETCTFNELKIWDKQNFHSLYDGKKTNKSHSLISIVHRIMQIRFPTEYSNYVRTDIDFKSEFKNEAKLIQSQAKNEIEWIGQAGVQNMVRLDGSLTNKHSKVVKLKNDKFVVKRK